MNDEIFLDGVRYVSAADAATHANLTRDYVARLCRQEKIRGRQIGKTWYVDSSSLDSYVVKKSHEESQRLSELASQRQREYAQAAAAQTQSAPIQPREIHNGLMPHAQSLRSQGFIAKRPHTSAISKLGTERSKALLHKTLAKAHGGMPSVATDAISRAGIAMQGMHHPVDALSLFVQKVAALALALSLTFGTYAFVDETYANFAIESIRSTGRTISNASLALVSGDAYRDGLRLAADTKNSFVGVASQEPSVFVANAASSISESLVSSLRSFARSTTQLIDSVVFGAAFPVEGIGPDPRATVTLKILPKKAAVATTTISNTAVNQTVVQQPVIERILERERLVATEGVTSAYVDKRLNILENKLSGEIYRLSAANTTTSVQTIQVIGQATRIDQLAGVDISSSTFSNGSITGSSVSATSLSADNATTTNFAVTGIGTSTFAGGIDLSSGCVAVNGTCITGGGGGGTPGGSDTQVQFNDNGTFAGDAGLTFSSSTDTLTATNIIATLATTTSATSTNFFSTLGRFTTGIIDSLIATTLQVTGQTTLTNASSSAFSSNTLAVGATGTTTISSSGALTAPSATITFASTTGVSSSYASSTSAFFGNLSVGALTGLVRAASGVISAITTSAGIAAEISDETGTGSLVFSISPTFTGTPLFSGFISSASTTIGGGTQTTGLTVSGGATTTGNAYFAGDVGIGATNPGGALEIRVPSGAGDETLLRLARDGVRNWDFQTKALFNNYLFLRDADAGVDVMTWAPGGYVGIGTSNPGSALEVQGRVSGQYFVATSTTASVFPYASSTAISSGYASSTNAFFGNLSVGSLSGFLKATAGAVSTALVNLASDVSGILPVANGGTGWANLQSNTLLLGNGTGAVATTSAGTNGQVLGLVGGVPTWVATTTLSTISGTLGVTQGGTGLDTFVTGDLLYANGANSLTRLPVGSAGQVLKVSGGLPTWGADQTSGGGGGAGAWATTTDSLAIYPADTSDVVIIGTSATVTPSSILEVTGSSYFSGNVGIGTTSPWRKLSIVGSSDLGTNALAGSFTATSTLASVFPYASSTAFSSTYASSTNAFFGNLSVGVLTGLLRASSGVVSAITASADIASIISDETGSGALVFGTSPTISGANLTGNTTLANASSSAFSSNTLAVGGTGTTSVSSTGELSTPSLIIGSLTGVLKATAGVISAAAVNLATEVTGILGVSNGGTGWANLQSNTLLLGNGTGAVATTSAGTNGQVLGLVGGVPTWVATTTLSTISGTLGATQGGTGITNPSAAGVLLGSYAGGSWQQLATSSLGIAISDTTGTLAVNRGGTGATSLSDLITLATHTAGNFIATITGTANQITVSGSGSENAGVTLSLPSQLTLTNASSSAFSSNTLAVGGTGTTSIAVDGTLTTPSLVVGSLTGLVRAASGVISAITTSADIASTISDETGSGALVFGTSPTISGATLSGQTTIANASTSAFSANTLAVGGTGTTSIASTGALTTPSLTIAALSGFLKATAGAVSTALVNLTTDITGVLGVSNGGTGWANLQSNTLLLGNGTGAVATTSAGTNGQVLGLVGGVPTWVATTTLSTISGTLGVGNGGTGLTSTPTYGQLLVGNGSGYTLSATSSLGIAISDTTGTLAVNRGGTGATSLSDLITLATHTTGNFIATITGTANQITVSGSGSENAGVTLSLPSQLTLTNASSSAFSSNTLAVGGTGTTSVAVDGTLTTPSLVVGSLTGLLKAASGVVSAITTSADIASTISDETGTGNLVFSASPTFTGIANFASLNTSGNVGIGTSTPYSRLTAWGAATGNIFEAVTNASSSALTVSATGFGTTTLSGLSISGSATSTSNVGFNITTGCFAINGTCLSTGGGGLASTDIDTSSEIAAIVGDETGSGALVFGTSPTISGATLSGQTTIANASTSAFSANTLAVGGTGTTTISIAGALSTPALTVAAITGLVRAASGVISAITTSASIAAEISDETGSGALVFGTSPTISGATLSGQTTIANASTSAFSANTLAVGGTGTTSISTTGAFSTPAATIGTLTGLIKAATGVLSAITTSAGIAGEISDETGTGNLVFSASPTLTGTASVASLNATGQVGVGTSTPWAKLAVQAASGQTNPVFEVASSSDATIFLSVSGTGFGTTTLSGLNISGSATSTSNVGFNITTGCFAINGTCLSAGGGGLASTDIDTSSEIAAIVGDETGSGALVFGTAPTISGANLTGNTTLANATSTGFYTTSFGINSEYITDLTGTGLTITGGALTFNTQIIDTSSELAAILTDETGTGSVVFSASPTFTGTATFAALNTTGNVGVGTSTPAYILTSYSATAPQLALSAGAGVAQWTFRNAGGNLYLATTTVDGTATTSLAALSILGSNGNIGIGTTTPYSRLSVTNAVTAAQFALAFDSTYYTEFRTGASGDLFLTPIGDDAYLEDSNLWVCAGGSGLCPTSNPAGNGNLVVENIVGIGTTTGAISGAPKLTIETQDATTDFLRIASTTNSNLFLIDQDGNVGIGTSTPAKQLSLSKLLFVGGGNPSAAGTATSTFQGDVLITGKLDVSTIDPVYTIDGTKYATYGLSSIGVKEEMATTITLAQKNAKTGKYEYAIKFDSLEEGSDLWLFYQVTEFGSDWKDLVVTATAGFDGTVSYRKDAAAGALYITSAKSGEVSLRLIANRFDAHTWPNLRPDQDGGFKGFEISSKKK